MTRLSVPMTAAILLLPGAGYLALLFGLPLVLAVLASFGVLTRGYDGGPTLAFYAELFGTRA